MASELVVRLGMRSRKQVSMCLSKRKYVKTMEVLQLYLRQDGSCSNLILLRKDFPQIAEERLSRTKELLAHMLKLLKIQMGYF